MSTNIYRLTVIASATAWFLLGLHAPIVHHITEHGRSPSAGLTAALILVTFFALGGLVTLLRARSSSE